jgi:alpha-galactosidase
MSKKLFRGVLCLAAVLAMGLSGAWAAETIARPEVKQPAKCDGKPADMTKPVKVFIMMGQSNMVGFGAVGPEGTPGTLTTLVKKESKYPFLVDDAGKWLPRSDVRCVFMLAGKGMQRNDWLQPGFGARAGNFGPELGFGHVIGQALNEPVLLIKACCGNRSLGWDYLPPGSERYEFVKKEKGGDKNYIGAGYKDRPDSWEMDKAKGKATEPPQWIDKRTGKVIDWYAGKQYDDDVANAKTVLADIGKYYPGATKYEIAGFVWWQGHKDQNPEHAGRYETNLVNLIKALRKDFNAPNAPFVLATGCGNPGTESYGLQIAEAQLAMNDAKKHPEFAGNVKCIDSRGFWPKPEESPSKQGYHYYWNAGTYMEVGNALGWAMAEMLKNKKD